MIKRILAEYLFQQTECNLPFPRKGVSNNSIQVCQPVLSSFILHRDKMKTRKSNRLRRKRCGVVRFSNSKYDNVIIPISSPLDMLDCNNDRWLNMVWYSRTELADMRMEARIICRQLRTLLLLQEVHQQKKQQHNVIRTPTLAATEYDDPDSDSAEEPTAEVIKTTTRGLEPRYCIERQRRKLITRNIILKVADHLKQSEQKEQPKLCLQTLPQQQKQQQSQCFVDNIDLNASNEVILATIAQRCNEWATSLAIEEGYRDFTRAYKTDGIRSMNTNVNTIDLADAMSIEPLTKDETCHSNATSCCHFVDRKRQRSEIDVVENCTDKHSYTSKKLCSAT